MNSEGTFLLCFWNLSSGSFLLQKNLSFQICPTGQTPSGLFGRERQVRGRSSRHRVPLLLLTRIIIHTFFVPLSLLLTPPPLTLIVNQNSTNSLTSNTTNLVSFSSQKREIKIDLEPWRIIFRNRECFRSNFRYMKQRDKNQLWTKSMIFEGFFRGIMSLPAPETVWGWNLESLEMKYQRY